MNWFKNQTMKNKTPANDAEKLADDKMVADLVAALHDMRDKLVNAALILKDVQFEIDTEARQWAAEQTNFLLEKVKP